MFISLLFEFELTYGAVFIVLKIESEIKFAILIMGSLWARNYVGTYLRKFFVHTYNIINT